MSLNRIGIDLKPLGPRALWPISCLTLSRPHDEAPLGRSKEKGPPALQLFRVQLIAEAGEQFSCGASSLCFRWGPSMPGRVETLPCAELGAWWTADEERWLGRSKQGTGFLTHALDGEVPLIALFVGCC